MKKTIAVLLVVIMILSIAVGCNKKTIFNENVIAMVNEQEITVEEFNFYLREFEKMFESEYGLNIWDQTDNEGKKVSEVVKDYAIEAVVRSYILLDLAKEKGIDFSEEELEDIEKQVLEYIEASKGEDEEINEEYVRNLIMSSEINQKLMENEMKDYRATKEEILAQIGNDYNYKKYVTIQEFGYDGATREVRARHILISTMDENQNPLPEDEVKEIEKEAQEILAKAKAGEDFIKLVEEYSQDPGSVNQGGEYKFTRGVMVSEFEEAAFNMEVGQISELVKTDYGFHIIKLEEIIEPTEEKIQQAKEYENDIENQMNEHLKRKSFEDKYNELAKEYKVEINKDLLATIKVNESRNNLIIDKTKEDSVEVDITSEDLLEE